MLDVIVSLGASGDASGLLRRDNNFAVFVKSIPFNCDFRKNMIIFANRIC